MKVITFAFSFASLLSFSSFAQAADLCPKPWVCKRVPLKVPYTSVAVTPAPLTPMLVPVVRMTTARIRMGYYPETGAFRGNILYFEGLGDSMLNHGPLFEALSSAGYRVIAFDYMGQGGSTGSMDRTRILSIPEIGNAAWREYAVHLDRFPGKTILGWSTGGLAAYTQAVAQKADRVILIAPGIAPNLVVGAGAFHWPPNEITLESLTTAAPYGRQERNPHLDPISPISPVYVPAFAADLILTAKTMETKKVSNSVAGLVLLSGADDTYVDAAKTKKIVAETAPHFAIRAYEGALHEIDNERTEIQQDAIRDILSFLDGTL